MGAWASLFVKQLALFGTIYKFPGTIYKLSGLYGDYIKPQCIISDGVHLFQK